MNAFEGVAMKKLEQENEALKKRIALIAEDGDDSSYDLGLAAANGKPGQIGRTVSKD
jgi:hypothetical protein